MSPTGSSFVQAIGHDSNTNALHIRLKGGHYVYSGVPADIHQAMMASESVGRFYGSEIKGKFACEKVELEAAE